jgi:hypothetical protein
MRLVSSRLWPENSSDVNPFVFTSDKLRKKIDSNTRTPNTIDKLKHTCEVIISVEVSEHKLVLNYLFLKFVYIVKGDISSIYRDGEFSEKLI